MVILEEGNLPQPQCLLCDMLVGWKALNGTHRRAAECNRGADWNRHLLAAEEEREVTDRAFRAYGIPQDMGTSFRYLGRAILAA